jgi:uncharacterized membrane protein YeaQ/YmgE (transglycosylase-associated protein family)
MGLIAWIVVGVIVGGAANWIVKGGFGIVASMIGGIIGAVIAGYVTNLVAQDADALSLNFFSLVMAVFFAIIVVGVAKFALGRGSDA